MSSSTPVGAHARNPSDDDWAPATMVSDFDDHQQTATASSLPDWDQWDDFTTTAGPSNSSRPSFAKRTSQPSAQNQADDDFFAALERSTPGEGPATSSATASAAAAAAAGGGEGFLLPMGVATPPVVRPPSPPEIDLEQRRIEERDRQLRAGGIVQAEGGGGGADEDWFAKFERNLKSGRGRSDSQLQAELGSEQLESMKEAHASPLPTPLRPKPQERGSDYFSQGRLAPPPSSSKQQQQQQQQQQQAANNSWWGSIRHLGSDWAHRAADYLDPGVDFSDEELKLARKMGVIDLDSRTATPAGGATPARGNTPAPIPGKPERKGTAGSSSSGSSAPAKVVSGAPGVDFSSLNPKWNAGGWTLPADDPSTSSRARMASAERMAAAASNGHSEKSTSQTKKQTRLAPLPVSLTGRREDSSPVITDSHAAHLQPHLPPRLKLGRTWRLCYSSDQHGISLETLYDRVGRAMDSKPGSGDQDDRNGYGGSSSASSRQDGWLRGASSATRAALGGDELRTSGGSSSLSGNSIRLGSGLTSMRDAGLILAVRDERDQVFGAFINERLTRVHRGYYGNGECFLFRQTRGEEVVVYAATARNNFYALGEKGYLAFGGSSAQYQEERRREAEERARRNGSVPSSMAKQSSSSSGASSGYGLWLDEDFSRGVTARCETFENAPLAQSGEDDDAGGGVEREQKFEPVFVEVWAVGLD
ncbi:hypothetical protein BDZ90DRAFT_232675 [Jaminaea rosea]|uniref:Oxidation resistance protein 1 n=1 Tax=Jaminaea rosea TaxID=1569628 RepID=A0A316UVH3_9BASI|nr:hypothetical protein BDZ90DRAFT_232675 [Jaminaea rosea]PWN27115.1 hypothetical protein BDZ90DRAFT_232675 [Jaminaea rosea]